MRSAGNHVRGHSRPHSARPVAILVVLSWVSVGHSQATMTVDEKNQLFERLSYATTEYFSSGVVSGRLVRRREGEPMAPDVLDSKVEDFEANLRAQISRGEIELSDELNKELQHNYGTTDYTRLLNNPKVSNYIEHSVRLNVESYRKVLENDSGGKRTESQITYRFDQRRLSARVDQQYGECLVGNQRDSYRSGASSAVVVDPQSHKLYERKAGSDRGNGYVREGSGTNQYNYYRQLGLTPVNRAGFPLVREIWRPEEMKTVTEVDTPEGPALKVVFEGQHRDRCDVLWVLPEKGYRLFKEENYGSGNLHKRNQFGQYKEVQPGMWYPMYQKLEKCEATLAPEVREKLRSGQLSRGSEEVFASQIKGPSIVEELWVEEVQPNAILDDSVFQLDFPFGTHVQDFMLAKSQAQPFEYVVGVEQTYQGVRDLFDEGPASRPSDPNEREAVTIGDPNRNAGDQGPVEGDEGLGVQTSPPMASHASSGWPLFLAAAVLVAVLVAVGALRQRRRE